MAAPEVVNITNNRSGYQCLGFEKVTVTNAAGGLTVPANTQYAFFAVETNPIRIRLDGNDPTATDGLPFVAGDYFTLDSKHAINKFKHIRSGGADGVLQIHYFG